MILQTHRALARLCSSQCLDKHALTALAFDITRVSSLRQAYLFKPALQFSPLYRSYATGAVSRPKGHTGRITSSPRKKASTVKTATPVTDVDSAAATTKPAAKQTKAKGKPKPKSAAKSKAKSASKPRTRAKSTKARKKPTKAKAKPAKKQKVLKPEEKERLVIKDLKAKALSPPKQGPRSAYSVLLAEKTKGTKTFDSAGSAAKECSRIYRAFTPEDRELYNHTANQNKASYASKYREWILTHSPATILDANKARKALRKRSTTKRSWPKLRDERMVSHQQSPFAQFTQGRHRSGDFVGMKLGEASKLISTEWRGLSEEDKKPYLQAAHQDAARYEQEVKAVYDRDVRRRPVKA
ncbi:MAG: hypothetical protein Q9169_006003 [Polycauliona sp. 2 TL-2023]